MQKHHETENLKKLWSRSSENRHHSSGEKKIYGEFGRELRWPMGSRHDPDRNATRDPTRTRQEKYSTKNQILIGESNQNSKKIQKRAKLKKVEKKRKFLNFSCMNPFRIFCVFLAKIDSFQAWSLSKFGCRDAVGTRRDFMNPTTVTVSQKKHFSQIPMTAQKKTHKIPCRTEIVFFILARNSLCFSA